MVHRGADVVEREDSLTGPQNGAATPAVGDADRMDKDGSCTSGKLDAKDQEADVLVLGVVPRENMQIITWLRRQRWRPKS